MDPGSITGIDLAIVPLAVQSIKSLKNTITRYKSRDKTLARLYHVLEDLDNILEVLERAVDSEASTRALLEGPVSRCNLLCREFETAMEAFGGKSKLGFRDWTKMEFMTGDINEFMDMLAGYKATISVSLGIITMQTSKLSHEALEEYNEMIQDTTYNLNFNLQRLDEKILVRESKSTSASDTSTDLRDERVVTEQCLRICQDASSYIESLAFEAQLLIRRTLNQSRDNLAQTIGRLQERLESKATSGTRKSGLGYLQLEEDLQTSKQCINASEQVVTQNAYTMNPQSSQSQREHKSSVLAWTWSRLTKSAHQILRQTSRLTISAFRGLMVLCEPSISPNQDRLRWRCSCGQMLYGDFDNTNSQAIFELAKSLKTLCSTERFNTTSQSSNTRPAIQAQASNPPGLPLCDVEATSNFLGSGIRDLDYCAEDSMDSSTRTSDPSLQGQHTTLRKTFFEVCVNSGQHAVRLVEEVTDARYHYYECPLKVLPPMPAGVFLHYLSCAKRKNWMCEAPEAHAEGFFLQRLPKKVHHSILDEQKTCGNLESSTAIAFGWGVHILEGPDHGTLSIALGLGILLSLVISLMICGVAGTQEQGFGIGQFLLAVIACMMTALYFKLQEL
ncbi:hypothetical protein F53441_12140 [Fusarium austroafricanum]|uniref:Azaphilone pigments biosynthesis cluster protein L N-terminal domain-containing protein n=1 Tax=Fusarium austroafricanum TaxID=2364996 RepID=A0A8H4K1V1_9HYPO|nr:hypothetical protein F53441_12140 [Fusarium austroafricanum]